MPPKCSRCGGAMLYEPKRGYTCLACGEELRVQEVSRREVAAPAAVAVEVREARPADWQQLAQQRLRWLIAEVQASEQKRAEAERIHQALTVMDSVSVPELPWSVAKPSVPGSRRAPVYTCRRCGRHLHPGEVQLLKGKGPVCRLSCDEREVA